MNKEDEKETTKTEELIKVVVVVGATGTGKSRLALELAERLGPGAGVVNADAMQCYAGLDTLTNKAGAAERARVPHHCLAHRDPLAAAPYDVRCWTADADRAIAAIAARGGTPVVVGGTHYYVEALLWRNVLSLESESSPLQQEHEQQEEDELADKSNEEVHAMLRAVDPATADRLHPNNRRKVVRALQVARETGQPLSALLHAQHTTQRPRPRYRALVLWVDYASLDVLDARLDARVDEMAAGAMFPEIAALKRCWMEAASAAGKGQAQHPDFERGIFQAIGLRQLWDLVPAATTAPGDVEVDKERLDAALDAMKQATRRYARQQRRWLANRFARTHSSKSTLLRLVVHNPARWDAEVLAPAQAAVTAFLCDEPVQGAAEDEEQHHEEEEERDDARVWAPHTCEACKRTLHGDAEWAAHTRSKRHKTSVKRARLSAQNAQNTKTESTIE